MDALNMFHVLNPGVQQLGNGIRLCKQDVIQSKTIVCFLDGNGNFHFGFGYRNGCNVRVVCWEDDRKKAKTIPKGVFVIAFSQLTTQKTIKAAFDAGDFNFPGFGVGAQNAVRDELIGLNNLRDKVDEIVERLAGLTFQQLDEVVQKIDELNGNN